MPRPVLRTTLTAVVGVVTGLAAMLATLTVSAPGRRPPTWPRPGNFTGLRLRPVPSRRRSRR